MSASGKPGRLHTMKLNDAPFDAVASGAKTIELRLYDEKRRAIVPGDFIEFVRAGRDGCYDSATSTADRVVCEVVAMHVYASFDALYRELPLESCGYTAEEIANGMAQASDMRAYYSAEDEVRYGVVGIELAECINASLRDN